MSIAMKGGVVVVMPTKHFFILSLALAVLAGCNVLDRHSPPSIAETPPYWQPQSGQERSQLADMRAFHERETARMSEDMRIVHNRELARLEAAGKELERDKRWQEDYEKTLERRERWSGLFKKTDKNGATPMVSRIGGNVVM